MGIGGRTFWSLLLMDNLEYPISGNFTGLSSGLCTKFSMETKHILVDNDNYVFTSNKLGDLENKTVKKHFAQQRL